MVRKDYSANSFHLLCLRIGNNRQHGEHKFDENFLEMRDMTRAGES